MTSTLLHAEGEQRTFAIIFETGDEVVSGPTGFAQANELRGSHFMAIGAFSDVVVADFDSGCKAYDHIPH